jgi:hypothetical protein
VAGEIREQRRTVNEVYSAIALVLPNDIATHPQLIDR